MRRILKEPLSLYGVPFGKPGDVIRVTDALPGRDEDWEDVAGYCDIYNETTKQLCWGTWLDVDEAVFEPVKTRKDVIARILEYYREEFPESEPTVEDTTDIGLAHTELYWDEVDKRHSWSNKEPLPMQISLNLETRTVAIHLGDKLVDSHTFPDYHSLYTWVDKFSFEDIFSLKI